MHGDAKRVITWPWCPWASLPGGRGRSGLLASPMCLHNVPSIAAVEGGHRRPSAEGGALLCASPLGAKCCTSALRARAACCLCSRACSPPLHLSRACSSALVGSYARLAPLAYSPASHFCIRPRVLIGPCVLSGCGCAAWQPLVSLLSLDTWKIVRASV